MSMPDKTETELIELTKKLLTSIVSGDWNTYQELCDPTLTAFEPEACGHLVEGLAFHKYYFDLKGDGRPRNVTIVAPHVRVMGDAAVVNYVRLGQSLDASGSPGTSSFEETRVWQRRDGRWRHVHFHRSPCR
jgi:hypothetical protein